MVLGTEEIYNWRRVLFLSQEAGRVDAVEELADGEDCGTINIQLLQKLEAITVRLDGPHARDSSTLAELWSEITRYSPSPRRVHVHGETDVTKVIENAQELLGYAVVAECIKEVVHPRAYFPDIEMWQLERAFRNRSILEAQFSHYPEDLDRFAIEASKALLMMAEKWQYLHPSEKPPSGNVNWLSTAGHWILVGIGLSYLGRYQTRVPPGRGARGAHGHFAHESRHDCSGDYTIQIQRLPIKQEQGHI